MATESSVPKLHGIAGRRENGSFQCFPTVKFHPFQSPVAFSQALMAGMLVSRDGAEKVTIRNFSRSGAQVAARDPTARECDVLLSRGSVFAAARVVWVSGADVGLKFYRELSPDEVEGSLPDAVISGQR
jgi:hypothetical protein